jgi:hypothetical protein
MSKTWFRLVLLSVMTVGAVCIPFTQSVRAEEKDESSKAVDAFKKFLPKLLEEYRKSLRRVTIDEGYDVKKTDSLISPFDGVLSFKSISDDEKKDENLKNGIYMQYTVHFGYDGKTWKVTKSVRTFHFGGDQLKETDETESMAKIAEKANQ